ncbi:Ldb17p KNAG_0C03930 [Huiozyma naganishii CBS 8797]|uniref:SPIN90/Ldb17 leucine-rich domain-containing protein n=1 Tax=Huiozyma naganishii (strain ATCC MYA-139 / BCRC 22969 / CBS 8797 / KCTC 17520 / NBRC 10181 / NCYC 3082 / Yp74L-3) TaxID=1071383 RepID=J7RWW0_HUIN7|nr:hypothetical protein KNAG_0C03930 [Kazachstania naganishii CBS 8797]CCK69497.1 hypothetical protein KNAG_0C03930 [Kazachstania naganishii CBS 8797]
MIIDPSAPNASPKRNNEEIVQFWQVMEDTLDCPDVENTADVNSRLVTYLKTSTDSYKDFINSDKDIYRMALTFVESQMFNLKRHFCLGKLLSLLNIDLLEMNMKFIISYILLFECKRNLSSLDVILDHQGFNVIYNTLYTQFAYLKIYGGGTDIHVGQADPNKLSRDIAELDLVIFDEMEQISTVLMDILFQIFKYCKCCLKNVELLDDFFIHYLIVSIRSDTLDDLFNNAKFKLVLAINEQYMILEKSVPNKIGKYLVHNSIASNFIELLLLKFNRIKDASLQIMMCKILYHILTTNNKDTVEHVFYLNDLNVFVDVLIRELQDISEQEEVLRNIFLRVLAPLLKNSQLADTHYRAADLNNLLNYLSVSDNICSSGNVLSEHDTTVKLARKCLTDVPWLNTYTPNEADLGSRNNSGKSSRASSITAMAMSFPESNVLSSPSSSLSLNASINNQPHRGSVVSNQQSLYSGADISAESLGTRKTKPLPPPPVPPSRKFHNSNSRKNATSHLTGVYSTRTL